MENPNDVLVPEDMELLLTELNLVTTVLWEKHLVTHVDRLQERKKMLGVTLYILHKRLRSVYDGLLDRTRNDANVRGLNRACNERS